MPNTVRLRHWCHVDLTVRARVVPTPQPTWTYISWDVNNPRRFDVAWFCTHYCDSHISSSSYGCLNILTANRNWTNKFTLVLGRRRCSHLKVKFTGVAWMRLKEEGALRLQVQVEREPQGRSRRLGRAGEDILGEEQTNIDGMSISVCKWKGTLVLIHIPILESLLYLKASRLIYKSTFVQILNQFIWSDFVITFLERGKLCAWGYRLIGSSWCF